MSDDKVRVDVDEGDNEMFVVYELTYNNKPFGANSDDRLQITLRSEWNKTL